MNVDLRMEEPGQDWKALAAAMSIREDLRSDVTMVVEDERLSFVDPKGGVVRSLPRGQWVGDAISDIDTMLDLLAWLESQFVVRVADGRFGCPVRGWSVMQPRVHQATARSADSAI